MQGTRKSSEISCLEIPFHFRFCPHPLLPPNSKNLWLNDWHLASFTTIRFRFECSRIFGYMESAMFDCL